MKKLLTAIVDFMYAEADLSPEAYKAYTEPFSFETGIAKRSS